METPGVLRINLRTFPDIIDPQKSSFVNEIADLKMIYEGLTSQDESWKTVPGAAESWKYNDDATAADLHYAQDLKYSDGSLLNAKRFEYSLLRNIDPATAGEYAAITDDIVARPNGAVVPIAATTRKAAAMESIKASHAAGQPARAMTMKPATP